MLGGKRNSPESMRIQNPFKFLWVRVGTPVNPYPTPDDTVSRWGSRRVWIRLDEYPIYRKKGLTMGSSLDTMVYVMSE